MRLFATAITLVPNLPVGKQYAKQPVAHPPGITKHPFSPALPGFVARWLDMPKDALPGDSNMPRVQAPDFGASERFAVAPGNEEHGYFEMAGGQSGHPLSPYYGSGHEDWVAGKPTPFLPGPARQTLHLRPVAHRVTRAP